MCVCVCVVGKKRSIQHRDTQSVKLLDAWSLERRPGAREGLRNGQVEVHRPPVPRAQMHKCARVRVCVRTHRLSREVLQGWARRGQQEEWKKKITKRKRAERERSRESQISIWYRGGGGESGVYYWPDSDPWMHFWSYPWTSTHKEFVWGSSSSGSLCWAYNDCEGRGLRLIADLSVSRPASSQPCQKSPHPVRFQHSHSILLIHWETSLSSIETYKMKMFACSQMFHYHR